MHLHRPLTTPILRIIFMAGGRKIALTSKLRTYLSVIAVKPFLVASRSLKPILVSAILNLSKVGLIRNPLKLKAF